MNLLDPEEAASVEASGILGKLGGPSLMPQNLGSILAQAGAAAHKGRMAAMAQNEATQDRMALRAQREQAVREKQEAALRQEKFNSILGEQIKTGQQPDEISILGAGVQSGVFGPREITEFMSKVTEKKAAREQKMEELRVRLEDQRTSREEREKFQRDLVDIQAKHREDLARLQSTLRPQEPLVPVRGADGVIRYTARSQAAGQEVPPSNTNRPIPPSGIKDLADKGETATSFIRLSSTFKDDFGGKGTAMIGDAQNLIGRNIGAGKGPQADWWQDYQNQKNLVRNKLFGSALTATEAAEFDKANINPGMTPDLIRKNLARQKNAAIRAAKRLSGAYQKGGYSEEQISEALGLSASDLAGADEKDPWEN
jgi:hypothetical protein